MADRDTDILLIGGGIAPGRAAATLRDEGFEGSILLAGRELDPPYHRPPASKGYLRGRESKDDALVRPAGWWEEHGVYLRTLGNADTIRRDVEGIERVVCVGGSYIGSEVAASLTELGKRVTVLMQEAHPLEGQFGARAGAYFRGVLEVH